MEELEGHGALRSSAGTYPFFGYPVRATLRAIRPNGWQRLVVEVEAVLPPPHR
ncbi:MAG: hypothetical protein H6732_11040 [Alphaproteobacteria bacterium]|nr:hypothetical protein [Alphaproteobacteria bacterium]